MVPKSESEITPSRLVKVFFVGFPLMLISLWLSPLSENARSNINVSASFHGRRLFAIIDRWMVSVQMKFGRFAVYSRAMRRVSSIMRVCSPDDGAGGASASGDSGLF